MLLHFLVCDFSASKFRITDVFTAVINTVIDKNTNTHVYI